MPPVKTGGMAQTPPKIAARREQLLMVPGHWGSDWADFFVSTSELGESLASHRLFAESLPEFTGSEDRVSGVINPGFWGNGSKLFDCIMYFCDYY